MVLTAPPETGRAVRKQLQITLAADTPDVFIRHPPALLKIFVAMGNDGSIQGIRASTVRLIQASVDLIDDDFRHNPEVTELFLTLLRSREHLFSQQRRMERYGILGAYIPEFLHIIGQMQFDLFHIYTVDAHTLQVNKNLDKLHPYPFQRFNQLLNDVQPAAEKSLIAWSMGEPKHPAPDFIVQALQDEELYIVIHSEDNPSGELRGWLLPR